MKEDELRWLELQLYCLITDTLLIKEDFEDVKTIIKASAVFNSFDLEAATVLARDILMTENMRPSKEEFMLLGIINHIPRDWIKTKVRVGRKRYLRTIKTHKENPMKFYPRCLTKNNVQLAEEIITGYNILRKAGVPSDTNKRAMGFIQGLRRGSIGNESLRLS